MERKKYILTGIVFGLLFSFNGTSQTIYKQAIYDSYISGKMDNWKKAVDKMEMQKKAGTDYLLELINYQYGYIGWCLGNDRKGEAREYLTLLEENLGLLKELVGETADYHAYFAAYYGFKIGLKNWQAPLLGPKSMEHAKKALEQDSLNFQANMEMGNIWKHMPPLFGGSDKKALNYYLTALRIIEKSEKNSTEKNWMYLNLLAITGQIQNELGNQEAARFFLKKALDLEPNFIWVKKELWPTLN